MAGKERKHIAPSEDTFWTLKGWAIEVEGKNLDDTIAKVDQKLFGGKYSKKKKEGFDF